MKLKNFFLFNYLKNKLKKYFFLKFYKFLLEDIQFNIFKIKIYLNQFSF